jgi:hypothetical protein
MEIALSSHGTINVLRRCRVHRCPLADASQPILPAACSQFQCLAVRFEPGRLPHQVRSRQLLGSRLQHRTSSDIDNSVEVSGHELLAFVDTG